MGLQSFVWINLGGVEDKRRNGESNTILILFSVKVLGILLCLSILLLFFKICL